MNRIIAIPSNGPELNDTNNYKKLFALENRDHLGCMEPVINMVHRNVNEMIVGGIGGRPYMGFIQYNIKLYKGIVGTLKQNIDLLIQGKLQSLNEPMCKGH